MSLTDFLPYDTYLSLLAAGFVYKVIPAGEKVPPLALEALSPAGATSSRLASSSGPAGPAAMAAEEFPRQDPPPSEKPMYSMESDATRPQYLMTLQKIAKEPAFVKILLCQYITTIPHGRSESYYSKLLKSAAPLAVEDGPFVEFEGEDVPPSLLANAAKRRKTAVANPHNHSLRQPQSFRWGAITFVFKHTRTGKKANTCSYQATCCRRTHVTPLTSGGRTLCTKTLTWSAGDAQGEANTVRRLKFWSAKCKDFPTKRKHGAWTPALEEAPLLAQFTVVQLHNVHKDCGDVSAWL